MEERVRGDKIVIDTFKPPMCICKRICRLAASLRRA
jgi:hypothetical protein